MCHVQAYFLHRPNNPLFIVTESTLLWEEKQEFCVLYFFFTVASAVGFLASSFIITLGGAIPSSFPLPSRASPTSRQNVGGGGCSSPQDPFFFKIWHPPCLLIYRMPCVSPVEFRAQAELWGIQPLPIGVLQDCFLQHFFFFFVRPVPASVTQQILIYFPWEIQLHSIRKYSQPMFPDEFCAHFSLLNCIFIVFPPQNSEQLFSPLCAYTLQILADTSHSPLESLFGTVLCLWFLLPLLINRTPCALIA